MKRLIVLLLLIAPLASAVTRDNDDSCDIALLPAATLLLPYFEVDFNGAATTLFTVVNVTNTDRVAHVTLWTDRAEPVLGFNIYLTGYDAQAVNLYDVLARGIVAPERGTGASLRPRGQLTVPNPAIEMSNCQLLPGPLDADTVARVRAAFTAGRERAIGYATIDVVESCTAAGPTDPHYWTRDLRYDNVFTGDWQQLDLATESAHGAPLVHIRAVPEGGRPEPRRSAQATWDAGFARTFYGRFQPADAPRLDGRQPLPALFATRWAEGTSLHIWRDAAASSTTTEVVVFDENENAVVGTSDALPAVSVTAIAGVPFPGRNAGWIYLNLDASAGREAATQNWVVATTRSAAGRVATAADASVLGNGCSAPATPSEASFRGGAPIGPAPDGPARGGVAETGNDDSCDIAQLPAATLLLPNFGVDVGHPEEENTLFTITNTGPRDQIARVTLWTDLGYPVLTFNIYLTGYDTQTINLFDVIAHGRLPMTGFFTSPRGRHADPNRSLDLQGCGQLGGAVGTDLVVRMRDTFVDGFVRDFGGMPGCDAVGLQHDLAAGYATIDVVRNCNVRDATDPGYWDDVAFDNVLIGDSRQVDASRALAESSPMVHIRAVEGMNRTFYSRYQTAAAPARDRRQPLPSRFAVRWIQGTASGYQTHYSVWREPVRRPPTACGSLDDNISQLTEIVRFDEDENWVGDVPLCRVARCNDDFALPLTSRTSVADNSLYPQMANGAPAGWMYINLDSGPEETLASQSWVSVWMRAGGRYSASFDAAAMGNGCSAEVRASQHTTGTVVVGPSPNRNP
ncbi:MAG TPA: hypothetical protein VNI54_05325 [Thermoanaerobaculia bacterium]|nr:hypothetical protein [Thermoanaerobaculia bacterium]